MRAALVFLIAAASANAANYSYSVYNPNGAGFQSSDLGLFTTNVANNSSITCAFNGTSCPIMGGSGNGGSLILTTAPQADLETRIGLDSAIGTGGAVIYAHASSNALSTLGAVADAGTFDALHIYNTHCAPDGSCSAYWAFYERTSSGTNYIANGSIPYWPGVNVRVVTYGTTLAVMANDQFFTLPITLTGGYPGVGAYANPGGAVGSIQIGPRCMTTPNPISTSTVNTSAYPSNVSLTFVPPVQPPDVAAIGLTQWAVMRNGSYYGQWAGAADFSDPNAVPNTSYSYEFLPISFHGVAGAWSSAIPVTTPSPLNVDPVRVGVKALGTYWGSAPESIDVASGNLNLTIPLLRPQGRGGWSVPIALTYNSQLWKSDSSGIQNLGQDVGYGYGWKMLAGSLTPFWNRAALGIDHYLYVDATGGQYRLYQTTPSNIWVSHLYPESQGLSGESIYVYYDSNTNMLHFRDGSSWLMGCVSSGEEQDAGTLYPTILEDRNGNQVIITYAVGAGVANYAMQPGDIAKNTSARIVTIEDTRATGTPRSTYNFTWDLSPDVYGVQHLLSIANTIGTSETYSFSFVKNLPFHDPWSGNVQAPYITGLGQVTNTATNTSYINYTDNSGQMSLLKLPDGAYLRWTYTTNTYQWPANANTIQLNAVNGRYLAAAANSGYTQNPVEWSYPITYTPAPSNASVVAGSTVTDSGAGAQRRWTFDNGQSTGIPVMIDAQRWGTVGGTMTELRDDAILYSHDAAGNPYVYQDTTTDLTGPSALYSMVQQVADTYGNVTKASTWDYSTTTPSGTATRVVNNTYKNNCSSPWTGSTSGDCQYVNAFMLSLPLASSITANSGTTNLLSNTYDIYTGNPLVNVTGISEFDSTYANQLYTLRGNVTQSVTPGKTTNVQYDITGMTVAANDNNNHAIVLTAAPGTNNSAPGNIQPNTGAASDTSLATALTYSPFLAVSTSTTPNSSSSSMTYDSAGRPATAMSPTGATTTYSYAFGTTVNGTIANGPYTTTATTGSHWATSVADGLGRTITQTTGYGTTSPTTVSQVDTQYAPCGCSPTGKMVKTSQPYAPGASEYWTSYTYDGLGRTLSVTLPDGASTTKYLYQGNWTTVTDPAGKWKQYQSDVFGNTVVVVEPDPAVNPSVPNPPSATAAGTLVTTYTYDAVNHLTGVSMPRTVSGTAVTQTRSFVFNSNFQLTSATSPETGPSTGNGTTSYTYNGDGTLATRTDPKNQTTSYSYDTYQRVTQVKHGTDATQTVSYFYDSDPLDTNGTFAQNTWGRVAAIEIGTCNSGPGYAEEYSYNAAGQTIAKRVSIYKAINQNCAAVTMTGSFNYDLEGKLTSVTYPTGTAPGQSAPLTMNYSYDTMSRLIGANDSEPFTGACQPPPAWNGAVVWASGAIYNAGGQLTGLTVLGDVNASCSSVSEGYIVEAWQYNSLNQLTEFDTSTQYNGYPYGIANPTQHPASSYFQRYYFSATQNNGQIYQTDDARLGYSIGYTYDALKRLTATTGTQSQTFQYDGFGNLTAKSVPAGSAEPAFPGVNSAKNQLSGVPYDNNGNATALNNATLGYDMENRLTTVTTGSNTTTRKYDASNHQVEVIGPTGNDNYSFYGPNGTVLATFTVSLTPGVTWYSYLGSAWVYFGGTLLGTTGGSAGSEYSSIVDRLGTGHPGYAYGTDIGSKTGSGVFDFATYMKDSTTGLDYANQRWYSAGMGRFLSVDPYGGSASSEDPGSWNRYTYGADDPINGFDPSGLLMSSDPGLTPFGPGFGGPGGSGCITSPWATGISFDLDSPAFDPYTMLAYGSGCSQFGMLLPNLAMMPSRGGGGGGDRRTPLTSKAGARAFADLAIEGLGKNCFKALGLSQQTLVKDEANEKYFDGRPSEDGGLNIQSVLGPIFSVSSAATFNSVSYGANAVTLNYTDGNISNDVVLGSNFFTASPNRQGITLVHELLHTITNLYDYGFAQKYLHYTGSATDTNAASASISEWLAGGCK